MSKKVKIFALVIVGLSLVIGGISFLGGSGVPEQTGSLSSSRNTAAPLPGGGALPGGSAPAAGALPGGAPVTTLPGATPTMLPGASAGMLPGSDTGTINEFSSLLSSINSINIDTSLFTNPAYRALRNYPVMLGTDVIGRSNPFAPVGSDSSGGPQAVLEVQTIAPGKVTSTTAEFGALVTLPDSAPVSVVFQYGLNDLFGSATTAVNVTKSGPVLVTVRGLKPGVIYMVQAVAVRGSTTTNANTVSFTTPLTSSGQ